MKQHILTLRLFVMAAVVAVAFGLPPAAFGAATIVILNNDDPNVGFNDPTVVAPVGGNLGVTLGQQRLNAIQAAASKWGATLTSSVTITIRADWAALTCDANSAVLAQAGALGFHRDFAGAFSGTWYNEALTGKILGSDPNAGLPEIAATFNLSVGQAGCVPGSPFYLGLDNNSGPAATDLVTVAIHEFGHGLGFQTFTNAQTGAYHAGFPTIFDRFLMDLTTGESWLQMTNAERAASAIKSRKLAWNGPQVQADIPGVLTSGIPQLTVNSPAAIAGAYDPGEAAFGPPVSAVGVTGNLKLANDGTAPVTNGCEAFPAAFFTGQIAVIDRGICSFKLKTLNAQNAGAIAVVIVNDVAGSPAPDLGDDPGIVTPITIPTIFLTQTDGNTIKAQLGGSVNGTIAVNTAIRAGADPFGKGLLYTPDPLSGGSTVNHWDTIARVNQIMEPAINENLTHEVTPPNDLTFSQMRDIGWVASSIPSAISKTAGDLQITGFNQPFAAPATVTINPATAGITVTWTANAGITGTNGTFPGAAPSAVSVTNASGVASAPTLTANGTAGAFTVNATVPGAGTTTFSMLVNPAGVVGSTCATDTTQADFTEGFVPGVLNNTDATTSPGNVVLANPLNADQTQSVSSGSGVAFNTTQWMGQTFTPGVTGQLEKIEMSLFCSGCSGADPAITVEVTTTSGGLPTSTVLATTTIPGFGSGPASIKTATFATPATLTAGTVYAYTMHISTPRTGDYVAIFSNAPTDYPNGQWALSPDSGGSWFTFASGGTARDFVFTTFMRLGYPSTGDYTSSLKDSNPPVLPGFTGWDSLAWTATVPAGTTLQFQAAASNSPDGPFNFVGPNGTAGTFFTTGADLSQFDGNRFLKYKAFFTTNSGTVTPTLADVTVCYHTTSTFTSSGVAVSGRVFAPGGRGLTNAEVTITDPEGATQTVVTGRGGDFRFEGVETGRTYIVSVRSGRFGYLPQTVMVTDNVAGLEFRAQ